MDGLAVLYATIQLQSLQIVTIANNDSIFLPLLGKKCCQATARAIYEVWEKTMTSALATCGGESGVLTFWLRHLMVGKLYRPQLNVVVQFINLTLKKKKKSNVTSWLLHNAYYQIFTLQYIVAQYIVTPLVV